MKYYKEMVQYRIDFDPMAVFSHKRLEEEVFAKYPQHKALIQSFVYNIKLSVGIAVGLILLLVITALILNAAA